jgi:signal peptidase I
MTSLVIGPTSAYRFPWKPVLQIVGLAVVITLGLIRMFLVEIVRVRGNVMAPALTEGDLALVRHAREAGRGDVVLIELGGEVVLRRVLGVPGDHIASQAGVLTLNELPIATVVGGSFSYREPTLRGFRTHRQQLVIEEIEPGRFLRVLGDHVGAGRPWRLVIEPATVSPGQFFVYCDNRRECPVDERAGLVPATAVVGVAQSLLWYGDARTVAPAPLQGATLPLTAGPLPIAPPASAPASPASATGAPLK